MLALWYWCLWRRVSGEPHGLRKERWAQRLCEAPCVQGKFRLRTGLSLAPRPLYCSHRTGEQTGSKDTHGFRRLLKSKLSYSAL